MKKTFKSLLILFALIIGTISLFGCLSMYSVAPPILPNNLIIQPDPENPFQGTWIFKNETLGYGRYFYVIEGMTATWYYLTGTSLVKKGAWEIEENDNEYTINGYNISVNNNSLTIRGTGAKANLYNGYERYL
jgi:ABC-type transport system involved in multi-copper enzyme maturation permease subunit